MAQNLVEAVRAAGVVQHGLEVAVLSGDAQLAVRLRHLHVENADRVLRHAAERVDTGPGKAVRRSRVLAMLDAESKALEGSLPPRDADSPCGLVDPGARLRKGLDVTALCPDESDRAHAAIEQGVAAACWL